MNNKTKKIVLSALSVLLLALIVTLILLPNQTGHSVKKETIKVGAVLPLTGVSAYIGQYMKEGIELAASDINAKGGVNGKNLEIVYEDSQGTATEGITAYNKLDQINGLDVYLTATTAAVLAQAPLAEKNKDVLFAIGTVDPTISQAGDYIFRNTLLPQTEAKYLAEKIYNRGYGEIAIFSINNNGGKNYAILIKQEFEKLGGKVSLTEMYEEKATDFRTSLLKLKNSNARAVFCLAHSQQFGLILKQAKELNLDKQWFGTFSAEGPTLINTAEETANGLIYSHFFDAGNPSNNFERIYLEEYQNEYGRQSEAFAALAYDNVRILAEAMKHCKNPEDTECVKNELYKIKDFQGATGLTSIDQNGDTTKQAILKTVKNQEFVLISN